MQSFNLNLVSAAETIKALADNLKNNKGSIVLFSTVAVKQGFPNHAIVSSAKGAVEGLTRSLAAEWMPKIRVNAIAPSLTDTPLASSLLGNDAKRAAAEERSPMKRIASATEVAGLAHWLLGTQSQHMTGQVLQMDGGMSRTR